MIRAVLYSLSKEDFVLQITIHHLACDGWSLGLLLRDLALNYRKLVSGGTTDPVPKTRVRYVDFARWQRQNPKNTSSQKNVLWWLNQLKGAPTQINLSADKTRPNYDSGSGSLATLTIPRELFGKLEHFTREEGATLYMILLGTFFILLQRHTGMDDFLVGSVTASRHRPDTNEIVGFFADTVVLRADLSGDPTIRQLLKRVQQTVISAIEHGDVPFEQIVDALQVSRSLDRHPVFQVLFNAPPKYDVDLEDLCVSNLQLDLKTSHFDLEMSYLGGANPTINLNWNTDLIDQRTAERMLDHYGALLHGIADDFDQPIGSIIAPSHLSL